MDKDLVLSEESLTQYFYKNLTRVNECSLSPLPHELILYSCEVLDKYAFTSKFFNTSNGKVNEKVLGIKFLEAKSKSLSERKLLFKDVGDTALVQLGLFSKSVDKKLVSKEYYLNLGKSAYAQLEILECRFYDMPNFFNHFSDSFEYMVHLLEAMSEMNKFDSLEQYLLMSDQEQVDLFKLPSKK